MSDKQRMRTIGVVVLAAIAVVALAFGLFWSGDSDESNESAAAGVAVAEAAQEDLATWQVDLNAVGCYTGPVDGTPGPQTEAAIRAFQSASGLSVDGLLGPATESALKDAAAAGETVCQEPASAADSAGDAAQTDGGGGELAALNSTSYDKSFRIGSCSLDADASNISLRGEVDGFSLTVDATSGTGTLGVSGGTESDGITLNGDVTGVDISEDRSFTVTGEFGEPNLAGEAFTLSGACPE